MSAAAWRCHRGDGEEADIGDAIERKGLPAPAVEHPARQRAPVRLPRAVTPAKASDCPAASFTASKPIIDRNSKRPDRTTAATATPAAGHNRLGPRVSNPVRVRLPRHKPIPQQQIGQVG